MQELLISDRFESLIVHRFAKSRIVEYYDVIAHYIKKNDVIAKAMASFLD